MELARRLADETADSCKELPDVQKLSARNQQLTLLYNYVYVAFANAAQIAKMSRAQNSTEPRIFVATWSYLAEFLKRSKKILKDDPDLIESWPRRATTFGPDAGLSALVVAMRFSERIETAVAVAKARALGAGIRRRQALETKTDGDKARKWRDMTIQELNSKTLPPVADWPVSEIHKDTTRISTQITEEHQRAIQER